MNICNSTPSSLLGCDIVMVLSAQVTALLKAKAVASKGGHVGKRKREQLQKQTSEDEDDSG